MYTKEEFRIMSIRYFEGKLDPSAEHNLFEAINEDKTLEAYFRQIEKEWIESNSCDDDTSNEWERLRNSIDVQADESHPDKPRIWLNRWYKVAAVALLLIVPSLLAGIFLSKKFMMPKDVETFYTCVTARGEKCRIILPDSTVVWLNSASSLTYSNLYGKENRNVELKGEGYFEVSKNKDLVFIVNTNSDYTITVKGTKFNLSSYDDDPYIETILREGAVEVNWNKQVINLKPGQIARLDKHNAKLSVETKGLSPEDAWTENHFAFDDISITDLVRYLSRNYDVNITLQLKNPDLANHRLRISLRNNEKIDDIFSALQQILPIRIIESDGQYIIQ